MFCRQADLEGGIVVTYVVRASEEAGVFYGVLMGEQSASTHLTK